MRLRHSQKRGSRFLLNVFTREKGQIYQYVWSRVCVMSSMSYVCRVCRTYVCLFCRMTMVAIKYWLSFISRIDSCFVHTMLVSDSIFAILGRDVSLRLCSSTSARASERCALCSLAPKTRRHASSSSTRSTPSVRSGLPLET